jgi:threonine/homoserine/homoserine lactone efflux protein
MVFFTLALSLCVLGLVAISLWWSWLFIVAILESLRSGWKLKKPEREPRGRETTDQPPPGKGHCT